MTFTSVFKKKVTHKTGPRILDGPPVAEPSVPKGAEYLVAQNKQKKVPAIPRYSRRAELARRLTSEAVPEFRRNIVNRLWAMMMGRGLVHPVDLHHSENPPADAELLELLAREFMAMRYDIKAFLRELALTRVYQRSSEAPAGASPGDDSAGASTFVVASLKTETPEQLAWSVMQGLGLVAQTRMQVEEKLDGHDPKMRAIFQTDARRRALRATMIEERVHDRCKERRGVCTAICRGGRPASGRDRADGSPGPLPEQWPADPELAGPIERQPDRPSRRDLPTLRPLPTSCT